MIENIEIDNSDEQINELSNQSEFKLEDFFIQEINQADSNSLIYFSKSTEPPKKDKIPLMRDNFSGFKSVNNEKAFSNEENENCKDIKNANNLVAAVASTPQHVGKEMTPVETVEDSVHTFYKSPSPTNK